MKRVVIKEKTYLNGVKEYGKFIMRIPINDIRIENCKDYVGEIKDSGMHMFSLTKKREKGDIITIPSPYSAGDPVFLGESFRVSDGKVEYLFDGKTEGTKYFSGRNMSIELARTFLRVNTVDVRKREDIPSMYELIYSGNPPSIYIPIKKIKEKYLKTIAGNKQSPWCWVVYFEVI